MIFNYIGNYSLIISLIISLTIFFLSISSLQKINIQKKINLNKLNFFQFFFVLVSFFSLVVLFVLSEFSNITVFNNSHTTKSLFYKISGTWGNHEGSLLLWLLILTLSLFLYFLSSKNILTMISANNEAYKSWKNNGIKVSKLFWLRKPFLKIKQFIKL